MNLSEENRMIYEFLGVRETYNVRTFIDPMQYYSHDEDRPMFDNSWEFLMPVIKKIYELDFNIPEDSNLIGDITHGLIDIDLAHTYFSVIEFIKYYNKNK